MVRAERNEYRASAIDERDHQVLLYLLDHKILTTHQISSLCFRSLRRCQHRLRELKEMGLVSSFSVGRGFGEGRAPACWYLTKPGLVEIADAKDVRVSDLPWVNAFFCALAEASRARQGHCLATWRPEHSVRTRAAEVKPDGFGRYLHPAGACEFYLEYDRATEAPRALSRKLEGYLKLAAGWTRERELTGFPNLLVLVPEEAREEKVATAFRSAVGSLHVSSSLASSFPLSVASEDRLTELGVLGPVWKHVPTDGERLSLPDLPARSRDLYQSARCLGRYFTDADPSHRRRIAPVSATPRFRALPPRHAP
jgi:hypothetical protein